MNLRKLLEDNLAIFNQFEQSQLTEFLMTFKEDEPGVSLKLVQYPGDLLWTVYFTEWEEFLLNSFPTKKEALDFCKKYELSITDINEEYLQ